MSTVEWRFSPIPSSSLSRFSCYLVVKFSPITNSSLSVLGFEIFKAKEAPADNIKGSNIWKIKRWYKS
ncbi:hypothetical protein O6P43_003895 [Quillaja saponaria]|uniref:Uncharacterized protein n=1 Tax=Quillaja saponaria TaxID=32244 RepID=A0AAD7VFH5_QUISA|nr:hypothetical protein O6P43_003895 [Quillaja saponaria]